MGSSNDGSTDTSQTTSIRYAPYVEWFHEDFLGASNWYLNDRYGNNPYAKNFLELEDNVQAPIDVDWMGVFYGTGYTFTDFPSLYDMYGKFLAGLDIEVLWEQSLSNTQDNAAISALTNAHADILDEQITDDVLPRFRAGLRDINAITSSSYWIGVSNIEAKRDHDIAKFDAELRYKLIPVAADRWAKHLGWNHDVISQYVDIIKMSILTKLDQDNHNFKQKERFALWPWTIMEFHRANLGALQGATTSSTTTDSGTSSGSSALGGALGGAALGASVSGGNPIGAAIGGAIGLATSFF